MEIVEAAINNGIDVREHNDLALMEVLQRLQYDKVELLLKHGARHPQGQHNLLWWIVSNNDSQQLLEYLLRTTSFDQNVLNKALIKAKFHRNINVIKLLLEHGADVQTDNNALLRYLIKERMGVIITNILLLKIICEAGADVNVIDNESHRPILFHALVYPEYVKILLQYGATPTREMIAETQNPQTKNLLINHLVK